MRIFPQVVGWFPKVRPWIIGVGVMVVTLYLYGGNLDAQWGCVDDHEIAQALGADQVMHFHELWGRLMETEVGRPGNFPRYRPMYYGLRFLEAVLWGGAPRLWYAARLAFVVIALGILWTLLSRWIGLCAGGLVSLWVASDWSWTDIFCRLGPSEAYAVVGVALFMYGLVYLANGQSLRHGAALGLWSLLCLGVVMAIGSKENFLILLPFVWMAGVWAWRRHGLRISVVAGLAVVTALTVLIAWAVLSAVSKAGGDVYGNSINAVDRLSFLGLGFHGLVRTTVRFMRPWQFVGAVVSLVAVIGALFHRKGVPQYVLRGAGAIAGLVVLYSVQFVFYNGELPAGTRYDFPAMMVVPLLWAALGAMVVQIIDDVGGRTSGLIVRMSLMAALVLIVIRSGEYVEIRETCVKNVRETRYFTRQMEHVSRILKECPEEPLTLVVSRQLDYEYAISVQRFLRYYGVKNEFYLDFRSGFNSENGDSFQHLISRKLRAMSVSGKAGMFKPLQSRPVAGHSFAVSRDDSGRVYTLGQLNWK